MTHLNIIITFSLFLTVVFCQLLAGFLFYTSSIKTLTAVYHDEIENRLGQINLNIRDQIGTIDSVYPLFMSNTIVRENLDPVTPDWRSKTPMERRLEIERQMGYLLVSHYLWSRGLLNAVYIFDTAEGCSSFSLYKSAEAGLARARNIYSGLDKNETGLVIRQEPDAPDTYGGSSKSIYFTKNVFSMYTGKKTAAILIDINEEKWRNLYNAETDENYLFLMYGNNVHINFSGAGLELEIDNINEIISASKQKAGFQVIDVDNTQYLIASEQTGYSDLTSVTGAPRQYLMRSMNKNLRAFVMLYLVIIAVSFVLATILSYTVTNPIKKMISYVRAVSVRHAEPDLLDTQYHPARPEGMFVEFDEFASAFDEMLKHLEKYYADIHHQQLLLKNAEIKALHAQMAPHFLFNVLNTIAWKAEMNGNTDIYKMTISLSELLRANILSNDKDFVSFKEELSYVKFYVQLQQYRFEDKFTVEIHCDEKWYDFLIPRFSIQSLVENAICHGLEPLSRNGLLIVTVSPYQENSIYVEVADNGAGFPRDFDINAVPAPHDQLKEVRHTRVGLKNLNQRLKLLGSDDGLSIKRELKGECMTFVSFSIPTMRGNS